MIVCGIKHTFGSLIVWFYGHLIQLFVPAVTAHLHHLVEVPVRKFRLQVHRCIVTTYGRNSHFNLYFFHIAESKHTFHRFYFQLIPKFGGIIVISRKFLDLLIALQHKVYFSRRAPPSDIPITFHCIVIYFANIAVVCIGTVSFTQVNQYRGRFSFGIGITMKTYPVSSCQFGLDIVSVQN